MDPYKLDRLFRSFVSASLLGDEGSQRQVVEELGVELADDPEEVFLQMLKTMLALVCALQSHYTGIETLEEQAGYWGVFSMNLEEGLLLDGI